MAVLSTIRTGIMALPMLATLVPATAVAVYPIRLPPPPSADAVYARVAPEFTAQGCFQEPPRDQGRALGAKSTSSDTMTIDSCASFCSGFKYFGTEYGRECWCGNAIAPNSEPADGACTMPCAGDSSQVCGAGDHLSIYLDSTYSAASVATVQGATYSGCVIDNAGDRVFKSHQASSDNMTPQTCSTICGGYAYFGIEFGRECYCGDNAPTTAQYAADDQCDMTCAGDSTALCGAGDRLSVYSTTGSAKNPETVGDYEF